MIAAANRSSECALALVESGADVKFADGRGYTALHHAAQTGDVELVKKLIASKADVNARNNKIPGGGNPFRPVFGELTPLHLAARANQLEIMKLLAAAGSDPKLKGEAGITLLMQAAGSSNLELVKYAFELDPDVKAATEKGMTVIHACVTGVGPSMDQAEICRVIQFLADKGAPLDERNAQGRTPIDVADFLPIDKAVELLTDLITKSGAKPKTPTKR